MQFLCLFNIEMDTWVILDGSWEPDPFAIGVQLLFLCFFNQMNKQVFGPDDGKLCLCNFCDEVFLWPCSRSKRMSWSCMCGCFC